MEFVHQIDLVEYATKKEEDSTRASRKAAIRSIRDEVNFWCIVDALNFGSGFRYALHHHCRQGAYNVIVHGVSNMLAQNSVNQSFLSSITQEQVASFFGIPLEASDLALLVNHLVRALHELGESLSNQGDDDMAEFILRTCKRWCSEHGGNKQPVPASFVVATLIDVFPPFNDQSLFRPFTGSLYQEQAAAHTGSLLNEPMQTNLDGHGEVSLLNGRLVHILKKAQLLVADLHRTVGRQPSCIGYENENEHYDPGWIRFSEIDQLTVFSDNVLPAVLRKLGILQIVSPSLAALIDQKRLLPAGQEEVELRLGAVHACNLIITQANKIGKDLGSCMDLDYYLWVKGKDPGFREWPRHRTIDTYYY